jgi:multidrug efflux pump subunit AcrB
MVGQFESSKDTVQVITESAATHIGNIATIITGAVRDIARETGDWLSDVIEMREASARAQEDEQNLHPVVDVPVDPVEKPSTP